MSTVNLFEKIDLRKFFRPDGSRSAGNRRQGFTFLEMTAVVAIIGILMYLISFSSGAILEWARESTARSMIGQMEAALEIYNSDLLGYPASGNNTLVEALATNSSGSTDWHGPYMQFSSKHLQGTIGTDAVVLDPWQQPYNYVFNAAGTPQYRIWSNGENKTDNNGTGDDIKSTGW